jgi:hypothetical protein
MGASGPASFPPVPVPDDDDAVVFVCEPELLMPPVPELDFELELEPPFPPGDEEHAAEGTEATRHKRKTREARRIRKN